MEFSKRLSALRRQKGISQEKLAELLGVSRQAVSKWENGESQPELSKLLLLCELFGVTPNDLLGSEAPEQTTEAAQPPRRQHFVDRRSSFWLVVALLGFAVAFFCFVWALAHPWNYDGISGLWGSLLGTGCLVPFLLGCVVTGAGLFLWAREIFGFRLGTWLVKVFRENW